MPEPIQIIDRRERWVAVRKPAGLAVHRTRGVHDALLQRVRDQIGARLYPVHRLDRATSGLLVFGLDSAAAALFAEQFAAGQVDKTYQAVVRGHPLERGTIDSPLRDEETGVERDALSHWHRLATTELPIAVGRYPTARYALLELRPRTGRTHQLRRHLAHIRHPIVGDVRHGDGKHNRAMREHLGVRRLLLFATELRFVDPFDRDPVELHADLDEQARSILTALKLAVS